MHLRIVSLEEENCWRQMSVRGNTGLQERDFRIQTTSQIHFSWSKEDETTSGRNAPWQRQFSSAYLGPNSNYCLSQEMVFRTRHWASSKCSRIVQIFPFFLFFFFTIVCVFSWTMEANKLNLDPRAQALTLKAITAMKGKLFWFQLFLFERDKFFKVYFPRCPQSILWIMLLC